MQLPEHVEKILAVQFEQSANCFSISKFYFQEEADLKKLTADEMLDFVSQNFRQILRPTYESIVLIWSRSSEDAVAHVDVTTIAKREPGFPFGLILEHSFVWLDDECVFQKRDPSSESEPEIITRDEAVKPYLAVSGFEVTYHEAVFEPRSKRSATHAPIAAPPSASDPHKAMRA